MLRCPKCKLLYNDETQKFCTGDGTRLLPVDQDINQAAEKTTARRTPTGELLFETFISPPASSTIKKIDPTKGKPSYQMFGLHSAGMTNASSEAKATNGFHSFDYLIVKDETKLEEIQLAPTLNKISTSNLLKSDKPPERGRFGSSFVLLCLLSALIFLTCLAFAANYFFSDQQQSPVLPASRQTSATLNLGNGKEIVWLAASESQFALRKNI